jgi:maleate cis-trans isomerase
MSTWRATIGWLKPGAVDRTIQDVFAMTPADVNVSVLTSMQALDMMDTETFDAGQFEEQRASLLSSVLKLDQYAHPDVFAVTGDLIQSAMGVPWNVVLQADLQAATSRPVVTAMTAVTDALRHLGVQRLAIASPFREDQNAYVRAYLESDGFEVTAIAGYDARSVREVKGLPFDAPLELGKQVFRADANAQAVYLPCPIWRVSPMIEPLEQACGVPVVTMLNTVIWSSLVGIGGEAGVRGFGQLLENVNAVAGGNAAL